MTAWVRIIAFKTHIIGTLVALIATAMFFNCKTKSAEAGYLRLRLEDDTGTLVLGTEKRLMLFDDKAGEHFVLATGFVPNPDTLRAKDSCLKMVIGLEYEVRLIPIESPTVKSVLICGGLTHFYMGECNGGLTQKSCVLVWEKGEWKVGLYTSPDIENGLLCVRAASK